ncbi:MAG: presenilin family intramembrane aspartyl protease [Candidatus Azambacteria bacterium]|nr:presenilin family intramembrane aspartyl protease [Candidatus Azambacteria bacterium]
MIPHNLNLKMFLQELVSFSLIGVISIFSVAKIYSSSFVSETQTLTVSWWQFLLAFGIGTAIVLGMIRIMHGGLLLRLFFLFALFSGTLITTSVFIPDTWAFIFSLFLIFLYIIWPRVWFHNLILILTLPGIAALLGASLNPWTTVLILIIMSVYDYVAVYKTKHMVRMAKAMISGRAIFAMIFPEHWHGFKSHLNEAHPGEGFMMLGTGDFVFPLIMVASAYTISPVAAWLVFSFALIGLLLMHLIFVSQKIRRPMPALPPLAAFAIIGFLMAVALL